MLRDEDIQTVKSSVTMKQIASMYGYQVNRAGFMRCPFHNDNSPSLKVYDGSRGFNCFVCHTGGDIIEFVMRHDNLRFEPAVRLIAEHFGIPIADGKHTLSEDERKRFMKRKAEQEAAENERKAGQERLRYLSKEIHSLKAKQSQFTPLKPVWCWMQRAIENLEREWDFRFENYGK